MSDRRPFIASLTDMGCSLVAEGLSGDAVTAGGGLFTDWFLDQA
jgi:hypothetical protein